MNKISLKKKGKGGETIPGERFDALTNNSKDISSTGQLVIKIHEQYSTNLRLFSQ